MAETRPQTNTKDAGSATAYSLKAQPAHGVSDALVANLKTNQDDFFADLDRLVDMARPQDGCAVGRLIKSLDEPIKSKLTEVLLNPIINSARLNEVLLKYGFQVSSSDVLRRHRRRMIGKEGCKCPIES